MFRARQVLQVVNHGRDAGRHPFMRIAGKPFQTDENTRPVASRKLTQLRQTLIDRRIQIGQSGGQQTVTQSQHQGLHFSMACVCPKACSNPRSVDNITVIRICRALAPQKRAHGITGVQQAEYGGAV